MDTAGPKRARTLVQYLHFVRFQPDDFRALASMVWSDVNGT